MIPIFIPACLQLLTFPALFSNNDYSEELTEVNKIVLEAKAKDYESFLKLQQAQENANELLKLTGKVRKDLISYVQKCYNSYASTQYQKELNAKIKKILPLEELYNIVNKSPYVEAHFSDFIKNVINIADDREKVELLFKKISKSSYSSGFDIKIGSALNFSNIIKIGMFGPLGLFSVLSDKRNKQKMEEMLNQANSYIKDSVMCSTVRNYLAENITDRIRNFEIYNRKTIELHNRFQSAFHEVNGLTKKCKYSEKKINIAEELFRSLIFNLRTKLIDDYGNLSSDFMSLIKEYN